MSRPTIPTEAEYRATLSEMKALRGGAEGTAQGRRIDALAAALAAYEEERGLAGEREAERRLAELGGSDPHATAAPRRRFF